MRKTVLYLQYPRMIFADILYMKSKKVLLEDKSIKEIIDEDLEKYIPKSLKDERNFSGIRVLNYILVNNKMFRNVFYYRIQKDEKLSRSIFRILSYLLVRPLDNIEIGTKDNGNIEGGLKIMHSSGCIIVPHKAGNNLTVFQGVTIGDGLKIGETGRRNPDIGDNVTIMPNSVVAGGITIGNNVTIGAGSVVLKSVPDNCLVVGNPARIIKLNGEKVDIKL